VNICVVLYLCVCVCMCGVFGYVCFFVWVCVFVFSNVCL